MDALATPWTNARAAHLLLVQRMTPLEVGDGQKEKFDTNNDDQLMYTQNVETIEPFSSHIVPLKTGRAYMGEHIKVWYKPYELRMVPCLKALLYRTHTPS